MNETAAQETLPTSLLLVEDDAIFAMSQQELLTSHGYDVILEQSGEEAVSRIRAGAMPEVVLMDIDLGSGIDGTQAAQQILEMLDVPVVFLTSHREERIVEKVKKITRFGYVMKDAGEFVLLETLQSALELHQTYRKLRTAESRMRHIMLDVEGAAIQGYRSDGTTIFWNRMSEEFYGYTAEEALGRKLWDLIIPAEMRQEVISNIAAMAESGAPIPSAELNLKHKDGSVVEVYSSHSIFQPPDGERELFCIDVDLSERKRVQARLRRLNELFSSLGTDPEQNIRTIVEETCAILDAPCSLYNKLINSGESLYAWAGGNLPSDFSREERPEGHICYEATMRSQDRPVVLPELEGTEYEATDPNVSKYGLRSYLGYPVMDDGAALGALCIVDTIPRDFDENDLHLIATLAKGVELEERRKAANLDVHRLLEEKELLLREAHHRIKNDFEIVRSMLSLQARQSRDDQVAESLEEAGARISMMASLYGHLAGTGEFSTIRLRVLLKEIIASLRGSLLRKDAAIEIDAADIEIPGNMGTSFGIILNELVTNSSKYAGSDRVLAIQVGVTLSGSGELRLRVADNGRGFPEHILKKQKFGMGLSIVEALSRQYKGELSLSNPDGGEVILTLKLPKK